MPDTATCEDVRPLRVLRPHETAVKVGICNRRLLDMEAEGQFPKRFPLNPSGKGRAVGHLLHEVDDWIAQCAAARSEVA